MGITRCFTSKVKQILIYLNTLWCEGLSNENPIMLLFIKTTKKDV